ncbi:MAG TPA: RDD family protein [Steroidobacteraceae bacterium]|nr:RDD family protein [Steroidobacteraceae bacterium]
MIWYVRRADHEVGPLGDEALRALVGTGQITPDTQLWREGLPHWTAALELPGVLGPRGAAAPASGPQASLALPHEPATPWRRYWARSLDITVSLFLAALLISALRPSLIARLDSMAGRQWLLVLLLLPAALLLDTLMYWALGSTPGKAIAGIKVLDAHGRRRLSAAAYLGRNLGVYVFGLALGVPLISLIALLWSYRRAREKEGVIWDRLSRSRVYALSAARLRGWLAAGVYLLAVAGVFALGLHAQHNRSKYTPTSASSPILQQELTQAANGVNASSPRMIDQITRIDGASVGPGPLFTYEYTLTNMSLRRLSPGTLATLQQRLSAHVRQAVCRAGALAPILRAGATVRFRYRDRDGRELVLVSVTRRDCGF